MDAFRYWVAAALWMTFPPLLGFWLVVHPLVGFWRRRGPFVSYAVLLSSVLLAMGALFAVRDAVLGIEFGTHGPVVAAGLGFLALAAIARLPIERTLSTQALLGLPELAPDRHPGGLVAVGPYAWVRHPRYVQVSVALFGWSLLGNYLVGYVLAALWVPGLWLLVVLEERELRERFGSAYDEYARRVPRFVPRRP